MDVLSQFISVLCQSDWLFCGESCPRQDVHPGSAWSSSPACTWHCSHRLPMPQIQPCGWPCARCKLLLLYCIESFYRLWYDKLTQYCCPFSRSTVNHSCIISKRYAASSPHSLASTILIHSIVVYKGIRYDTRCYFNVRSKADISQLNLPHGTDN